MLALPLLRDVARHRETLVAATSAILPNALVYTNIESLSPAFGAHMVHDIYPSRRLEFSPISLWQLPTGTVLLADNNFYLSIAGQLISDYVPEFLRDKMPASASLDVGPMEDVSEPLLLGARYGVGTWGHWLGEILPGIVVAEHFYPQRFRYVLPPLGPPFIQSLEAYGIGVDRIFPIRTDRVYRFASLFAVSQTLQDSAPHPIVLDLVRAKFDNSLTDANLRVAVLRDDGVRRRLKNLHLIRSFVTEMGFTCVSPSKLSFREQVSVFQRSDHIVGVLGSGLTGLVYARNGVKVLSLSPVNFGDRFFYALTQSRSGTFADVRGHVTTIDTEFPGRDDEFEIEVQEMQSALAALNSQRESS